VVSICGQLLFQQSHHFIGVFTSLNIVLDVRQYSLTATVLLLVQTYLRSDLWLFGMRSFCDHSGQFRGVARPGWKVEMQ